MTASLIAINVLIYVAMVVQSHHLLGFDSATLLDAGASYASPGLEASRWRWLTAAFVHVGLPHAAMNLYVLGQIGIISERALGAADRRGLRGRRRDGEHPLDGARDDPRRADNLRGGVGAIMGLIGMAAAFAWLTGQRAAARSLALNILFVLGLGISLSMGRVAPIDNAAHIGGLVVGLVPGVVRARRPQPLSRRADVLLMGISLLLTIIAFAIVQLTPIPTSTEVEN